jgi:calcineurin-like phosphoesterase family protein
MNREIVRRHNERVKKEDTIYIVGDISLSKRDHDIERYISKMNGTKILILGNHDALKPFTYVNMGFRTVHTALEINTFKGDFVLVHDPAASCLDRTKIFLCAHIHDLFKMVQNAVNVGVDVWNFYPVSLDEICELIKK